MASLVRLCELEKGRMKPECSSALLQRCVKFWKRFPLREHLLPSVEEWREGCGKSWVVFDSEEKNELMKELKGRYVLVQLHGGIHSAYHHTSQLFSHVTGLLFPLSLC